MLAFFESQRFDDCSNTLLLFSPACILKRVHFLERHTYYSEEVVLIQILVICENVAYYEGSSGVGACQGAGGRTYRDIYFGNRRSKDRVS